MSSVTGYPQSLTRARDGSLYASVAAMDAWGHATLVHEGGSTAAVTTNGTPATSDTLRRTIAYGYDGNERLTSKDVIVTHNGSSAERKASYGYDSYGNRTQSKGVKTSNIRFMDQANRIRARITAASGSMSTAA
nr:hypothetical protein [Halomonas sp.]